MGVRVAKVSDLGRRTAGLVAIVVAGLAALATSPASPPTLRATATGQVELDSANPVARRRIFMDFDRGSTGSLGYSALNISPQVATDEVREKLLILVSDPGVDMYSVVEPMPLSGLCPETGPCHAEKDVVFALRKPESDMSFSWTASADAQFEGVTTPPADAGIAIEVSDIPQAHDVPVLHASAGETLPIGRFGSAERWTLAIDMSGSASGDGRWDAVIEVAADAPPNADGAQTMVTYGPNDDDPAIVVRGSGFRVDDLRELCPSLPNCHLTLGLEVNSPQWPIPTDSDASPADTAEVNVDVYAIWVGADKPADQPTLGVELTAPSGAAE